MTDPGNRVPEPLELEPVGVCLICGEEQLRTAELRTESAGGIRIRVATYVECGCGRRPA